MFSSNTVENNAISSPVRRNSSLKLLINRSILEMEKPEKTMNVLFIFPELTDEALHIDSICHNIDIEYNVIWPTTMDVLENIDEIVKLSNLTTKSVKSTSQYDLVIVDRRGLENSIRKSNRSYKSYNDINVDTIPKNIHYSSKGIKPKVVAYVNSTDEEFVKFWDRGYDEICVNYRPRTALRNFLHSFSVNQYPNKLKADKYFLINTVFDKLVESIEVLNSNFEIQMVNGTFSKFFKINNEEVQNENWFNFHHVTNSQKEIIINELKQKNYWEGFITFQTNDNVLSLFAIIKQLEGNKGLYIVSVNTFLNTNTRRPEKSNSLISHDLDSSISTMLNMESVINSVAIDSPILKILKIINSIQEFTSPLVAHHLQKVVEILSTKDLFTTGADSLKSDKVSTNLIDGLLSSNNTIYSQTETRRQSNSILKRHQSRLNSELIQEHITSILDKVHKIPQIPEDEEIGEIDELLNSYNEWSFDILKLEQLSEAKPLRFIGMKVFYKFDLGQTLQIDPSLFQNWLHVIEGHYNDKNPYHNSTHASDVLQSSVWFLERMKINEIFDNFDDAASIIAAIIHDLGHPGRTNPFLINSNHSLAVLYNDVAVLENHHASLAFKMTLKDDRINIFKSLGRDDYRALRHSIIDAVLATEMAKHFEHLTKFLNTIAPLQNNASTLNISNSSIQEVDSQLLSLPENKGIIRRMLIKCSDVNNPTRPFPISKEWANRISEEYFSQTDEEIARGLPVVMPHFNRKTCEVPKSQLTFIDLFLETMFKSWTEFIQADEPMKNLIQNKVIWNDMLESDSNGTISQT